MGPTADLNSSLRFLVIGAGCRGYIYAEAVTQNVRAVIAAVAEPRDYNRNDFGKRFIWGDNQPEEHQQFESWQVWLRWEYERRQRLSQNDKSVPPGIHGVFVCTLDNTHYEIMTSLAPLGLHVLCEKPLATSLEHCLSIYRAYATNGDNEHEKVISIGHVLRYNRKNIELRRLLLAEQVIGDIVALEHVEPVGWWHFAHSYVRGNWRKESNGAGSLLTKCCHDIDFIMWLLSSTPTNNVYHMPSTIASQGVLSQFQRHRKPVKAGNATNCLSCPAAEECIYNAHQIYNNLLLTEGKLDWPLNIVVPDIEEIVQRRGQKVAAAKLLSNLKEDYNRSTPSDQVVSRPWFGRCVYEADNNVCDTQFVTICWDEGTKGRTAKTATLHMISSTEKFCERRGRIYGTEGELVYDGQKISIFRFDTQASEIIDMPKLTVEEERSHGGGDFGLVNGFIAAVDAVENHGWDVSRAQNTYIGCTLDEIVRNHAVVFAAEEARKQKRVILWPEWWHVASSSIR